MPFLRASPLLAVALLLGCAHAPKSRWKAGGTYMVCACDGTERQPTPSEAESFDEDERVDTYCEGKVRSCHPGDEHGRKLRRDTVD